MKALNKKSELTPLGRILARLPIEPRVGKMLIFSTLFNAVDAHALLAANSASLNDVFVTRKSLN